MNPSEDDVRAWLNVTQSCFRMDSEAHQAVAAILALLDAGRKDRAQVAVMRDALQTVRDTYELEDATRHEVDAALSGTTGDRLAALLNRARAWDRRESDSAAWSVEVTDIVSGLAALGGAI